MKTIFLVFSTVLWLLTLSTIVNAAPVSMPDPDTGGPGGRFSFSLSGVIDGIASSSPLAKYNDSQYTVSGFFFTNGTIDITQLAIMPNPDAGGGGGLVAMPEPGGGGGGNLIALPEPGGGGPGSIITLLPRIEFTFPGTIGSLPLARFLSLDLNGTTAQPTIITFSYQAAPVPEPSTLCLIGAGLAGLAAARRRKNDLR
jgi:hypothetical protein